MRSCLVLGVCALVVGTAAGCGESREPGEVGEMGATSALPEKVSREGAREAPLSRERFVKAELAVTVTVGILPAEVVLPPEAQMVVAPPLPGRIVEWLVPVGAAVGIDTPLARIALPELSDLQGALEESKRVLGARERTLASERRAASQGLSSATEVAALEVAAAEARARRDALSSQIEVRRKAMRSDQGDGDAWVWRSAMAGIIERIECPLGQVARPDAGCLVIIDPERAVVRVHVPERWLSRWQSDEAVGAELILAGEDEVRVLTEVRRAQRLEERSRTLALDFRAGSLLQAGRSGRVVLRAAARGGLVVPEVAVTRLDGHDVVFARSGDGARVVKVERLGRDGERAVVRAIEVGDAIEEVAVVGHFRLTSQHVLASESEEVSQ